VIAVLKRARFPHGRCHSGRESEFGDKLYVRRDEAVLARHGVTRNTLIDRMRGRP
jgi:hypothetical protein